MQRIINLRTILYVIIIILGVAHDSLFGYVPELGIRGYFGTIVAIVFVAIVMVGKRFLRE